MSMNRRGMIAAGGAAPLLAAPRLASAQPQVVWRLASSFPKSTDVLWGVSDVARQLTFEFVPSGF